MEIFTLLETLEDILERSRNIPFSSKGIVDKEEMLEIIKEVRLKLPDELKQAKWVKEERQRIMEEAKKEADNIVKEAEMVISSYMSKIENEKQIKSNSMKKIESKYKKMRGIAIILSLVVFINLIINIC